MSLYSWAYELWIYPYTEYANLYAKFVTRLCENERGFKQVTVECIKTNVFDKNEGQVINEESVVNVFWIN